MPSRTTANESSLNATASMLADRLEGHLPAQVGIVLGTGLGDWATEALQDACTIPYADIPGLPEAGVHSHAGALIAGRLGGHSGGINVLALSGRVHLYEGYEPADVVAGVRLLGLLDVPAVVLTNAAGAINPLFNSGSLMLITDHLNTTGFSPLRGPNVDAWGPRFPDMSRVYDPGLMDLTLAAATEIGLRLERGVYAQVLGPQLETPAETRALRHMGADAVGMSTVMEAIALRHMGVRVLGISCLTNQNLPDCMEEATLEAIVATANASAADLGRLLEAVALKLEEQ